MMFVAWRRQVFLRNWHAELEVLFGRARARSGIYLIACKDEIVYVGQSWHLFDRPIDSLGRFYHRVPDTTLPWWIALAPCPPEEMDERESTAIRTFAPRFNTSIPNVPKSTGRLPVPVGVAPVFRDQASALGAFEPTCLDRQVARAAVDPDPPWRRKRTRKKSEPKPVVVMTPWEGWSDAELAELRAAYGLPANGPLPFRINLLDDGSVVTRDGEYLGTWTVDENEHPEFKALDDEVMMHAIGLLLLCEAIAQWHDARQEGGPGVATG
jgi:hypothetical protein